MDNNLTNSQIKRCSRYTVFVPLEKGQEYILAHGYTGALDLIDSDLAEQLMHWSEADHIVPASALEPDTVAYLEERGYLTVMTPSEEMSFLQDLAQEIHQRLRIAPPHFYLMPTYDCQLRCTYCFERSIQNTAQQSGWLGTVMSPEVIDAAFGAIDQLNAGKRKHSIELYGGEPLIRENRSCVEAIVKRGRERGYVFMAATNGVDLDAYLDLLTLDQIACVQVPVDGGPATHNKFRCYPDGGSSFVQIMQNVRCALERDVHIKLRVNATRDVLQHLDEFVGVLKQYSLFEYPRFSCYFKAVFPSTKLTEKQQEARGFVSDAEVVREISKYPELVSATGYPITDSRVKALFENQVWNALLPTHCGAASNIYVFDPFGNIYPCNNVVGYPQYAIGRFWPVFEWEERTRKQWHQRSVDNMPECLQCKYALLCGGGCLYRALVDNEDLYMPHCDNFARGFEEFVSRYYNQYYRA
jgi:uncharacterized protein